MKICCHWFPRPVNLLVFSPNSYSVNFVLLLLNLDPFSQRANFQAPLNRHITEFFVLLLISNTCSVMFRANNIAICFFFFGYHLFSRTIGILVLKVQWSFRKVLLVAYINCRWNAMNNSNGKTNKFRNDTQ